MAIPQGFIDELLGRVDLVEVVGRHVQLKRTGANYQGLCPFHSEKSPSFTVSPSKGFFHCFGCGKNGNAIGFLMEHTGSGFVETVKDLAQQHGLVVPQEQISPQEAARQQAQREQRKTLSDVLAQAAHAYSERLRTTPLAIDYLKKRGLSGDIVQRFGLGYAPDTWRGLASVFAAYDDPLLEQAGLVIHHEADDKRYDRFRGRVMFPIRNERGECIGFGGRVLGDEKPKYLNSPETPVFSKGHELYGLYEARSAIRDAGHVLVTEGYMDVVALAQLGLPQAVATLGTACTPDHMTKLFRVTDQVVFSFDGDAAGRRAAQKALRVALPLATDVRTVKFLFLPPEHDPDSFVRAHGKAAFEDEIKRAMPLSRFVLDVASEDLDLSTAEGRAQTVARAAELWQQLPPGALAQQVLADLAERARMDVPQVLASWRANAPRHHGTPNGSMQGSSLENWRQSTHTPYPSTRSNQRANWAVAEPGPRPGWTGATGDAHAPPFAAPFAPSLIAPFEPLADQFPGHFPAHLPAHFPGQSAGADAGGYPGDQQASHSGGYPGAHSSGYPGPPTGYPPSSRRGKPFERNARGKPRFGTGFGNNLGGSFGDALGRPRVLGTPTPRAEHAARLLLAQMTLWERLSEADHAMLCSQPAPVGPLLRWLDAQYQEQGAVAWGVLSDLLHPQPFAAFAQDLMQRHQTMSAEQKLEETAGELHSIMLGIAHDAYAEQANRAARSNDLEGLRRANEAIKRIAAERAAIRTGD